MKTEFLKAWELMCGMDKARHEQFDRMLYVLENNTDFFQAPASTKFHSSHVGGLVEHSVHVCRTIIDLMTMYGDEGITKTSATLVALLHDVCKIHTYKLEFEPATTAQVKYLATLCKGAKFQEEKSLITGDEFSKNYASELISHLKSGTQRPDPATNGATWKFDDPLPLGHGEKSLYLISKCIDLTVDEAMAIRWHMSAFDKSVHSGDNKRHFFNASQRCKLLQYLFTADYIATNLIEVYDSLGKR